MPSVPELQAAFKAYFDEIDNCIAGKCYWSLLHLLLVIPDICGALESPTGQATPARYESWCERYLRGRSKLTHAEWYDMRCAILHHGQTRAKNLPVTFSFGQPSPAGAVVHEVIEDDGAGGRIFRLDVSRMAEAMKSALEEWFHRLQGPARGYVQTNLPSLARVKPVVVSPPPGGGGTQSAFTSTSTST